MNIRYDILVNMLVLVLNPIRYLFCQKLSVSHFLIMFLYVLTRCYIVFRDESYLQSPQLFLLCHTSIPKFYFMFHGLSLLDFF